MATLAAQVMRETQLALCAAKPGIQLQVHMLTIIRKPVFLTDLSETVSHSTNSQQIMRGFLLH